MVCVERNLLMSNLPPAAAQGPGRRLSPAAKKEVQHARNVQGYVAEPVLRKQREQEQNPKPPRSASHIFPTFRDAHNVLRDRVGRFAKETAPAHKRLARIPWSTAKKNNPVA